MNQWLDDLLFYLPGFASIPIVLAGVLAAWLAWRLLKPRKKPSVAAPSAQSEPPAKTGIDKTSGIG